MTPAPVNKNRSDSQGELARRIPFAVWLGIGILVIAAAVIIGRLSAS